MTFLFLGNKKTVNYMSLREKKNRVTDTRSSKRDIFIDFVATGKFPWHLKDGQASSYTLVASKVDKDISSLLFLVRD